MDYRVAIEDIEANHWVAWVLDLPGCFSSARREEEALQHVPDRIATYARWRRAHGRPIAYDDLRDHPVDIQVVERFRAFSSAEDYLVNACFADDRRPLNATEMDEGCWLLTCTRQDLQEVLAQGPTSPGERPKEDEVRGGAIETLVRHIAAAERWYFGRLGFEQEPLGGDPLAELERVRVNSLHWLQDLVGDERLTEWRQEWWSARKVLRRTLWHERDHTQHIQRLLAE